MGDPAGAARHVRESLSADGTWMVVEPKAGDRRGREPKSGGPGLYAFSTLLCAPASLSQPVGLALGAQAGEARIREIVESAGFTRFTGGRDPLQHGVRGEAVTIDEPRDCRNQPGPRTDRARYPDTDGYLERDGVRIHYEVHGHGDPTVLLLPTWSIVSSRMWKMQVPYLARHARSSPSTVGAMAAPTVQQGPTAIGWKESPPMPSQSWTPPRPRAVVVAVSCGALWAAVLAAEHPERVAGLVFISPAVGLAPGHPERQRYDFSERYESHEGWAKYNRHYWQSDYPDFLQFFFEKCFNEPHSTKAIEDCIEWGLDSTPESLIDATEGLSRMGVGQLSGALAQIACPALVLHGDDDLVRPHAQGAALAAALGVELVTLEGSGHLPHVRDPVKVNHLLHDFIVFSPPRPVKNWTRARNRPKRLLFVSSPIGLGHVRRDVAVAGVLRELHPDVEVEWLAQHPVVQQVPNHSAKPFIPPVACS